MLEFDSYWSQNPCNNVIYGTQWWAFPTWLGVSLVLCSPPVGFATEGFTPTGWGRILLNGVRCVEGWYVAAYRSLVVKYLGTKP